MFDIDYATSAADRSDLPGEILAFAEDHGEALVAAAEWLGGTSGACRALDALACLDEAHVAPRRVLRLFGDLLDLLTLEHVHDMDREEAGIFAGLDLCDPRVEEVCLLADGLATALRACHEVSESDAACDVRRAAA